MNWGLARRVLAIGVIVLLPVAAFAQEAVLTGTVSDSTGAVLPGVTVTVSCTVEGAICMLRVAVCPTSRLTPIRDAVENPWSSALT